MGIYCMLVPRLNRIVPQTDANLLIQNTSNPLHSAKVVKPETSNSLVEYPNLLKKFSVPKFNHAAMPRAMNAEEYDTMMRLVRLTVHILEQHNISCVLTYGSLVGSYMMHDILPWDDDVDIFVHNDSKDQVMALFDGGKRSVGGRYGISGYYKPKSDGQAFKIFFTHSRRAGKYRWNYPFIDMFSFIERDNAIKAVDVDEVTVDRDDFYPFHKRPFGPLWINSPKNPVSFLKAKYKSKFKCSTWAWNHKKEKWQHTHKVSCESINKYYPFVKRNEHESGTVESLMLGSKKLYDVVINETFRGQKSMYDW